MPGGTTIRLGLEEQLLAIVDDEPTARKAVGRLLRAAGYEVTLYDSGTALLRTFDTQPPSCIVLDLHMPQVSGLDVLRALRAGAHNVPVIVVTGDDTSESLNLAMKLGASAYLTKPIDARKLLHRIDAALHASKEAAPERGWM